MRWHSSRLFNKFRNVALVILTIHFVVSLYREYSHLLPCAKDELIDKKDWHDWPAMLIDCQRTGIGEQGAPAKLDSKTDQALEKKLYKRHGLNALLSDAISVNRSLRYMRDERCLKRKYLKKLPTVSVVIPFHNELFSTFARTLHSLTNRSPPELLKEIILVDDFSDAEFFSKLESYCAQHFERVQFVRMPKRSGLILARLAGARKMTAEVLVILDAHIEVTHNWLPPLLEPIALNRRTVTNPLIDTIEPADLSYSPKKLTQGAFKWYLGWQTTELLPDELLQIGIEPYKNPIMAGGLFAISLDFFWELGGYDEGLKIWGAEQFELSFKIWMCGGQMLNVPCSRVGHHFRANLDKGMDSKDKGYLARNHKRVVDVWMDEYSKYYYRYYPWVKKIDAGDLTKQKALREKLHCKPFSWFMNEVATNTLKYFPPEITLEFAYGTIQSDANKGLCVDTLQSHNPGLYPCHLNLATPLDSQMFSLTWNHEVRNVDRQSCLDVHDATNASVLLYWCHGLGGPQYWYYDRKNKLLKHGKKGKFCLEAMPKSEKMLVVNICRNDNPNMKWNFGRVNETALDNFLQNKEV